jgi:hypothetical protein
MNCTGRTKNDFKLLLTRCRDGKFEQVHFELRDCRAAYLHGFGKPASYVFKAPIAILTHLYLDVYCYNTSARLHEAYGLDIMQGYSERGLERVSPLIF